MTRAENMIENTNQIDLKLDCYFTLYFCFWSSYLSLICIPKWIHLSYFLVKQTTTFAKKSSKINTLMIKHIVDHYHCTGKYSGVTQSICSLKYSIPKEIPMVFYN